MNSDYIKAHLISRAIREQSKKPEKEIFLKKLQPQFLNFLHAIF